MVVAGCTWTPTCQIELQHDRDRLPRLDAYLAAQVTDPKHLKGELGINAQAFVERSHNLGILPAGRALLAFLSRRCRVDRVRRATVLDPRV